MAMEDLMKALMQSAMQSQPQAASQQPAGGDALSQVLGGLMGGGQQAMPQQSGGGDMFSEVLGGLMGGGQQQAMPQQSAGGDMLSQVVGGLLGGAAQQGGGTGDALLGALEGIIGGQPGTGQALPMNQGNFNTGAANPAMMLLQPVVNQVAAKLNISPQIATVVASIALHYLLSSHPSTKPNAPLNLGSVMQQLSSGGISQGTLRNSGMVSDVMQATGMNKQDALRTLDTTFGAMGAGIQGTANIKRSGRQ